ncbi:hypothetical Cytosolic Protein [Cronobacter condimenti 1330]|uniref:Hypothetical Cytosolic Protein n=1 Tax=Cronobacter condimenti 1330 TaxID=1073999 RepID=K7ZZL9_9ENTR|nr:hypothetical protein AFK62_20190 [Cronobacter condimenti 1330]CCJ72181.1 hypothetical Cytosolic Protein [Cronobacter condimenti 1330]
MAFYNKKPEELFPDEKTVIANLVAAPGAAGGIMAAGNSTGIGSGVNAARVENNTPGTVVQGGKLVVQGCARVFACWNALVEKQAGNNNLNPATIGFLLNTWWCRQVRHPKRRLLTQSMKY